MSRTGWVIAVALVLLIAAAVVLVNVRGVDAAIHNCGTNGGSPNYYVVPPDIDNGRVSHDLLDRFGTPYYSGSKVEGYWVKIAKRTWEFRSGSTTTVNRRQAVRVCIAQKAQWGNTVVKWHVISPTTAWRQP